MKALFAENCTVDKSIMEMKNIRLQTSRWSRISTYLSGDSISFECIWRCREVSRPEAFTTVCMDGVIKYPTCG